MKVNSLTYCAVNGGPFTGIFAVQVELSSRGALLSSADVIGKILRFMGPKKIPIRICGDLAAATGEEMFGFCKTLKDFGLKLSLLCDGQSWTNWMSLVDWVAVVIGQESWLRFRCHELRYTLEKGAEVEPELPAQVPTLYLVPGKGVSMEAILRFNRKGHQQWGIIMDVPKLHTAVIWEARRGEKDESVSS